MNYQFCKSAFSSALFALCLSFFTSFSCHAQPNKNDGARLDPGLIDVKAPDIFPDHNKFYTILLRKPDVVIKSKYYSSDTRNIKDHFEKWENNNTVFAYANGLNDRQPNSLQIINGAVVNKMLAPQDMEALVVILPSGKISVYSLSEPIIKFKVEGIDPARSFALRNDDQDRSYFTGWATKEKATVFQTSLFAYKDKILQQKAGNPVKLPWRFLVNGTFSNGEEAYVIVQSTVPMLSWDAANKAYEVIKFTYKEKLSINYMISLSARSSINAFRVNRPDGAVYDEFKNTVDLSAVNDLLVFYCEGKVKISPAPDNQSDGASSAAADSDTDSSPKDSPENTKPVVDLNDLQSLAGEYTRLDNESDDLQDVDSTDPANKAKIEANRRAIRRLCKNLTTLIQASSGTRTVKFHGVSYSIYIANLDKTEINLSLKDANTENYFYSLGNVRHMLEDNGMKPLMITNGGMFTASHDPQGLYVEKGSPYNFPLDTREGLPGNFYLKPNGVFYIDQNNKPQIRVTEEVQALIDAKSFNPKLATQSGPMLVINNKLHPAFTKGSLNVNIRSGVGIFSDNRVIFAISNTPTNFYDFATLFRNILNCKNALYLDGAISKMYLSDSSAGFTDGSFGPIISVSAKNR